MTTPQYHFRHFNSETDIPRLARLLTEAELLDASGEDISEATLREQLTWPGHDPSQDRWIVDMQSPFDTDPLLIGFASVLKVPQNVHADITVVVHPQWRREGIGSEL